MNQDWQVKERLPSPISSVDFGPGQAWSGLVRFTQGTNSISYRAPPFRCKRLAEAAVDQRDHRSLRTIDVRSDVQDAAANSRACDDTLPRWPQLPQALGCGGWQRPQSARTLAQISKL